MNTNKAKMLSAVVVLSTLGISTDVFANPWWCRHQQPVYVQTAAPTPKPKPAPPAKRTIVRPTCTRPDVFSGCTTTLNFNFGGREPGVVMFEIGGTSQECELLDWQPNSVTVNLPRLGLAEPKHAEISIIMPTGRVAKTFKVRYISQPDIIIHEESIGQPSPPVPANAQPPSYIQSVGGGFRMYAK